MVDRILKLICENGISCNALEKELGFGNGAIKRFSTSSPSIDKIIAIAEYFNVSIDFLIYGNNNDLVEQTDSDSEYIEKYKSLNHGQKEVINSEIDLFFKSNKINGDCESSGYPKEA